MPFISASVISPYNSIRGGAEGGLVPVSLLLDLYPDAAAAYSLRKLRTDYAGSAIEVRRSSDNTEKDIGFDSNGDLDTTALLSFVGAGDGFVTIWYDQSGEGNNTLQTVDSLQPRIVQSGVIDTLNGFPAIYADGTKVMQTTSNNILVADASSNRSAFATLNISNPILTTTLLVSYLEGGTNLWWPIGYSLNNNGLFAAVAAGNADVIPYIFDTNSIISSINTTSNLEIFNNSVSDGGLTHGITTVGGVRITLFGRSSFLSMITGYSNEIILYPSDQTANREAIETNINNHYTIY